MRGERTGAPRDTSVLGQGVRAAGGSAPCMCDSAGVGAGRSDKWGMLEGKDRQKSGIF